MTSYPVRLALYREPSCECYGLQRRKKFNIGRAVSVLCSFAMPPVTQTAAQVLRLMAADPSGIVHLRFGHELVPMQLQFAKQWSKVLAAAIATEKGKAGHHVVIPMDCTKDDWLTVMGFCYATSPHPVIDWDNLEVLMRVADKYNMSAILDMCTNFLVTHKHQLVARPDSRLFGWKWIALADNAGLLSAAKACFDAVHENRSFVRCPGESILESLKFSETAKFASKCSRQVVDCLSPALLKHILLAYATSHATSSRARHSST